MQDIEFLKGTSNFVRKDEVLEGQVRHTRRNLVQVLYEVKKRKRRSCFIFVYLTILSQLYTLVVFDVWGRDPQVAREDKFSGLQS